MTKTHKTESELAVYRALFAHDAEYAARIDRALWRGECIALAQIIGQPAPHAAGGYSPDCAVCRGES